MLKKRNLSFNEKRIFYEKVSINFDKTKKEVVNYFLLDNVYLKIEFVCLKKPEYISNYLIDSINFLISEENSKYFDFENFSNILNILYSIPDKPEIREFYLCVFISLRFENLLFDKTKILISQKLFLKMIYLLFKIQLELFNSKKTENHNFIFALTNFFGCESL